MFPDRALGWSVAVGCADSVAVVEAVGFEVGASGRRLRTCLGVFGPTCARFASPASLDAAHGCGKLTRKSNNDPPLVEVTGAFKVICVHSQSGAGDASPIFGFRPLASLEMAAAWHSV